MCLNVVGLQAVRQQLPLSHCLSNLHINVVGLQVVRQQLPVSHCLSDPQKAAETPDRKLRSTLAERSKAHISNQRCIFGCDRLNRAYAPGVVLWQPLCLPTLQLVRRLPDRLTVAAIITGTITAKDKAHLTALARI